MSKPQRPSFTAVLSQGALIVLLGCAAIGNSQQGSPGPLPLTHGKTLSGDAVTLPDSNHAQTLIIAGFSKNSSSSVKAWWEQAQTLCQAHPEVACYQVAVLEEVPSFVRGMVLGSMKRGTPAAEQRSFVTVFENESAWKQTLAFNAPDDAYLGLFDKSGKLLWHTSGGEKAASSAGLQPALDATRR